MANGETVEGPEAWTRFQGAMKKLVSVPHAVIEAREKEYKRQSDANPRKRGPKRKSKNAERV